LKGSKRYQRAQLEEALKKLQQSGCEYADIRVVNTWSEGIRVKNGAVEGITADFDAGFGVRVLYKGAWGFASSNKFSARSLEATAKKALDIAKASSLTVARENRARLSKLEPQIGRYKNRFEIDPFDVPLDRKIEMLIEATDILRKDKKVVVASGNMRFWRQMKIFASTEGSYIEQEIVQSGGGIVAIAQGDDDVQTRSYPASHGGDFASRGFEFIEEMELAKNAERTREEVIELLKAPPCPSGKKDLILYGDQLALQVHESCGHPTELDRVLGTEISLAGGSFLQLSEFRKLRYGSPIVNITADATIEGGLGSFGYDDEGVPAQRTYLVKDGLFCGYLTSRETARVLRQRSNGTMRAESWNKIPLIRMTNINLEPQSGTLDDLIADTRDGLMFAANRSWSIDDLRLNFQFGCEIGYIIKRGRIVGICKNPNYTGITPKFWNSCDAICGREEWRVWGVPNCGKGEPMQIARVGHGTSHARFRKVEVGVKG